MSDYIDFTVVLKIVVAGLLAGAGLPALFALGLRSLTPAESLVGGGSEGRTATVTTARPSTLGVIGAAICFGIVVAAVAGGVYLIWKASH